MGADIHVYIEQRNERGAWEYCGLYDVYFDKHFDDERHGWFDDETPTVEPANIYTIRNYDLFSLLGNVYRGSFETVVPVHGYPEDMSEEVKNLTVDPDTGDTYLGLYGFNWFTVSELVYANDTLNRLKKVSKEDKVKWVIFNEFFSILMNSMYQSMNMSVSSNNDVRFVYWFDN